MGNGANIDGSCAAGDGWLPTWAGGAEESGTSGRTTGVTER